MKSIIEQFDLPKPKKIPGNDDDGSDDDGHDQAAEELLKLAGDIDLEEELMARNEEEEDDNGEGWIDEHEEMTADELSDLETSVGPVRVLLTKVRLKYIIICNFLILAQI